MACVTKRRGKWAADYRDALGRRRVRLFRTKDQAQDYLDSQRSVIRQARGCPSVNPDVTLSTYAALWLREKRQVISPAACTRYDLDLRRHILPYLGSCRVRDLTRPQIKSLLLEKLDSGLSRSSVSNIRATLRAMLNCAVDESLILGNPATGLGRSLPLRPSVRERQLEMKAMTADQVRLFLGAAQAEGRYYPLLFLLARTGLRLGEAIALPWERVDFERREIHVSQTYSGGRLGHSKGRNRRAVDMSGELASLLRELLIERKKETLSRGWSKIPSWVFCAPEGGRLDQSRISGALKRSLKRAGLPLRFNAHSLRHTFGTLLVMDGRSLAYVQRQLGHSSIQTTIDLYSSWLPPEDKGAVDRLDELCGGPPGAEVVAEW